MFLPHSVFLVAQAQVSQKWNDFFQLAETSHGLIQHGDQFPSLIFQVTFEQGFQAGIGRKKATVKILGHFFASARQLPPTFLYSFDLFFVW
jgi:hypothetical protein